MDKKILGIILAVIIILVVVYGVLFTKPKFATSFKSREEVSEAVTNVSSNIQEITSILTDIDKKLG